MDFTGLSVLALLPMGCFLLLVPDWVGLTWHCCWSDKDHFLPVFPACFGEEVERSLPGIERSL